jgi:hypothetical protein
MSIFNVNLELARPECSVPFGFSQKLEVTIKFPMYVFGLIFIRTAVKYMLAKCRGEEKFKGKHGGMGSREYLSQQALMMASSFFVICSIL